MDKAKSKVILDEDEDVEEIKSPVNEIKLQASSEKLVNNDKAKPVEKDLKDKTLNNITNKDKNIGSKPLQPINKSELLSKLQNAIKSGAPTSSNTQVKKPVNSNIDVKVNSNFKKEQQTKIVNKEQNKSFLNKKRVLDDEDEDDTSYKDEDSNESNYDSESYETYTEESDSNSESSNSSSSSSSEKNKKEKKKISPSKSGTKFIPKVKDIKPKEKEKSKEPMITTTKGLKTKENLVYSLLKRWWYAIDVHWYKQSKSTEELLAKEGLRKIEILNWKCEDNIKNGLKKCIELKGFPLVFLDCDDKFHDLRNMDNCPSYNNLIKKEKKELCELNIKAIKAQMEQLNSSTPYISNTSDIKNSLEEELGFLNKELVKLV